jgi:hypothetical protein
VTDIPHLKLLVEQLSDKDETVSTLLKAHLFTEHLIDQILGEYLGGNRDKVYRLKLGYAQKLTLLESFDLVPPEIVTSLSELNRLRNKSVHTLNAKPTPQEIRPIFDRLPEPGLPNAREHNDANLMLHRYMAFMCGYLPTPPADAIQDA